MIEQIFLAPQTTPLGEALSISGKLPQKNEPGYTDSIAVELALPSPAPGLDKRMQSIGLPLAFSFCSTDLNPVSLDADIAALSKSRYIEAVNLALDCKARYLLVPSLDRPSYQLTGQYRAWFGRTVHFWESILNQLPDHHSLTIVMVNHHDRLPDTISTLAKRLNHPVFKTGFDIGMGHLFSQLPPVDWLSHLGESCIYVRMVNYAEDGHSLLPISDSEQEAPTLATHLALLNRKLAVSLAGNTIADTQQACHWLQDFLKLQESQYVSKKFLV